MCVAVVVVMALSGSERRACGEHHQKQGGGK
jgi:hypothetical protein